MSATTVDTTYCEQVVRELDRDRWLACLFAPASHRPHLLALYAFHCEITRIRDLVSEPLPGEVRTVIISSWVRGGLLPKSVIEQMVPALPTHAATDGAAA